MNLLKISSILVAILVQVSCDWINNKITTKLSISPKEYERVRSNLIEQTTSAQRFDDYIKPLWDISPFTGMNTTIDLSRLEIITENMFKSVDVVLINRWNCSGQRAKLRLHIENLSIKCRCNYFRTRNNIRVSDVYITAISSMKFYEAEHQCKKYKNKKFLGEKALEISKSLFVSNKIERRIKFILNGFLKSTTLDEIRHMFYPAVGENGTVIFNKCNFVPAMRRLIADISRSSGSLFKIGNYVSIYRHDKGIASEFKNISVGGILNTAHTIKFRYDVLNFKATLGMSFEEISLSGSYMFMNAPIRTMIDMSFGFITMKFRDVRVETEYAVSSDKATLLHLDITELGGIKIEKGHSKVSIHRKEPLGMNASCNACHHYKKGLAYILKYLTNSILEKLTLEQIQKRFGSLYSK